MWLRAHLQMMPVLQSREALQHTAEIAVGSGSLKEEDQKPILAGWREVAGADQPRRQRMSKEQAAVVFGEIGIKVK